MDLLNEVINYIIAEGLATQKDVDIFKDYLPASPTTCTAVFEYTGSSPGRFTNMSVRSLQIVCRDKAKMSAKQKCWSIYKALYREDLMIQLGTRQCIINMRNTPVKISVDSENLASYAFNCGITTNFD